MNVMMPIGPLMIEHRLIERMIWRLKAEISRMNNEDNPDVDFLGAAVDFIRTYADKLHHGKEEGILFRELATKKISTEHNKIMGELIEEHVFGRKMTAELSSGAESYANGNKAALNDMMSKSEVLVDFYLKHIEKEDKRFFLPVMNYFTKAEQDAMLDEMNEFDRNFIHLKYREIVGKWEGKGK
jgi:hemerythrin-like domain-containing protein